LLICLLIEEPPEAMKGTLSSIQKVAYAAMAFGCAVLLGGIWFAAYSLVSTAVFWLAGGVSLLLIIFDGLKRGQPWFPNSILGRAGSGLQIFAALAFLAELAFRVPWTFRWAPAICLVPFLAGMYFEEWAAKNETRRQGLDHVVLRQASNRGDVPQ